MTPRSILLALLTVPLISAGPAGAADEGASATPIASVAINPSEIVYTPRPGVERLVLTVSGPRDVWFREALEGAGGLVIDPVDAGGRPLPDGQYTYEMRQTPALDAGPRETDAAKRGLGKLPPPALVQSGSFSVKAGVFVTGGPRETDEQAVAEADRGRTASPRAVRGSFRRMDSGDTGAPEGITTRDYGISDDLIVIGSQCTGSDCVMDESFGFDTIRLKENNLRIKFEDTSSIQNYPTNDWQISANESIDGGLDKFSIEDVDGGRTPFTIEAGAQDHALYVDHRGFVGIGTSTPAGLVHTLRGDTPNVRLEQDSSWGWPAQTWDVAGNETNFFVRDITHASRLPFRIEPGAPTSSLFVRSSGDVSVAGNIELTDEATVDGRDVSADGAVLDGLAASARQAGILPRSAFGIPDLRQAGLDWMLGQLWGRPHSPSAPATAAVSLATPYEEGETYVVMLTAVTLNGSTRVKPVVMPGRDRFGFTVSLGEYEGRSAMDPRRDVVEVHWVTQLVQ